MVHLISCASFNPSEEKRETSIITPTAYLLLECLQLGLSMMYGCPILVPLRGRDKRFPDFSWNFLFWEESGGGGSHTCIAQQIWWMEWAWYLEHEGDR